MQRAAAQEYYPIRTVASLTGVNPVTLRAWERRYGLVRPQRAPSGHRLYSRADVDMLRRVVELIERGVPVGRARAVLDAQDARAQAPAPAPAASPAPPWEAWSRAMLDAIVRFDESALNAAYADCLALHPVEEVQERVVVPLLRVLGERWSQQPGGIAEEHFFSNYLRNKLGARLHHLSSSARGPTLVMACMPDDRHDLGLLMFALHAGGHGYRAVMLGAAVPLAELVPAVRHAGAQALVLSMAVSPSPEVIGPGLTALVRALGVPVLVGGARARAHAADIEAAGASVLGASMEAALALIDARVRRAGPAARR